MNELKIFENAEFGSIRTVEINNEPYFVGKMLRKCWVIVIHERLS